MTGKHWLLLLGFIAVGSTAVLVGSHTSARLAAAVYPPDAVVIVDGVAHGRAELDAHRESSRLFSSLAAAQHEVRAFAEHLVLERAAEHRRETSSALDVEDSPAPTVSDAEVEAWYQANRSRFVSPRKVRVAYVRVATKNAHQDASELAQAFHVRAQMAQSPLSFARLLDERRAGVTAGELEAFSCDEAHAVLPAEAVRQACDLPIGALGTLVATDDAYFFVRKLAVHPAVSRPLARVQHQIRTELESLARNEAGAAARRRVLDAAEIVILEAALETLVQERLEDAPQSGPPRVPEWS